MHKTSNKKVKLQRIRPLTVEDASALKKALGKGKCTVTAVYSATGNDQIVNIFNTATTEIPSEYLVVECKKCGLNFIPTTDRQIWCGACNQEFLLKVLDAGEAWPL